MTQTDITQNLLSSALGGIAGISIDTTTVGIAMIGIIVIMIAADYIMDFIDYGAPASTLSTSEKNKITAGKNAVRERKRAVDLKGYGEEGEESIFNSGGYGGRQYGYRSQAPRPDSMDDGAYHPSRPASNVGYSRTGK